MIRYLLDTNICIFLIKSRSQALFDKVAVHRPGEIGISSITLAELEYGVSKSAHPERNREALRMFTIPLELAPFDDASAEHYGRVRSTLEAAGTPIGPLDTLIAAHGLALNAVVVTNNTREFTKVAGLRVEDWSVG